MKVSFSRKGFDSKYGGQPNVILPDGTLLPFPIPDSEGLDSYDSIIMGKRSVYDILHELKPRTKIIGTDKCHLDPDLRDGLKPRLNGWKPSFGQAETALSELKNKNFGLGDLFLFFGWFRETEFFKDKLRYKRGAPHIHLIYGYMQIGEIIRVGDIIPEWLMEHPHSMKILNGSTKDEIFLPTEKLSFLPERPGASMLKYSPQLVLTYPGMSRSKWKLPDFFGDNNIKISHSPTQLANTDYFQSAAIGQEMIWEATPDALKWLKQIINQE